MSQNGAKWLFTQRGRRAFKHYPDFELQPLPSSQNIVGWRGAGGYP